MSKINTFNSILNTSYPKDNDIIPINRPKNSSNFLSPNFSSIKKDNVSIIVISTPVQSGILN